MKFHGELSFIGLIRPLWKFKSMKDNETKMAIIIVIKPLQLMIFIYQNDSV